MALNLIYLKLLPKSWKDSAAPNMNTVPCLDIDLQSWKWFTTLRKYFIGSRLWMYINVTFVYKWQIKTRLHYKVLTLLLSFSGSFNLFHAQLIWLAQQCFFTVGLFFVWGMASYITHNAVWLSAWMVPVGFNLHIIHPKTVMQQHFNSLVCPAVSLLHLYSVLNQTNFQSSSIYTNAAIVFITL